MPAATLHTNSGHGARGRAWRTLALAWVAAASAAAAQQRPAPDTVGFRPLLAFAATDSQSVREAPLGTRLVVQVQRVAGASGMPMGWQAGVYARPVGPTRHNLLYHSRRWHGPYPTDLFAWSHRRAYFPDDRTLPVHGWPYDVRLVCRGCATEGDSTLAHFTAGTVEIGWRRLTHAHPATPR